MARAATYNLRDTEHGQQTKNVELIDGLPADAPILVVDVGHNARNKNGLLDAGVIKDGISEIDASRAVLEELKDKCADLGMRVIVTVDGAKSISKRDQFNKRIAHAQNTIATKGLSGPVIGAISLHTNAGYNQAGGMIFSNPASTNGSHRFATTISGFYQIGDTVSQARAQSPFKDGYGIINAAERAGMDAALVELGNFDNPTDLALFKQLVNTEKNLAPGARNPHAQKLAQGLADGAFIHAATLGLIPENKALALFENRTGIALTAIDQMTSPQKLISHALESDGLTPAGWLMVQQATSSLTTGSALKQDGYTGPKTMHKLAEAVNAMGTERPIQISAAMQANFDRFAPGKLEINKTVQVAAKTTKEPSATAQTKAETPRAAVVVSKAEIETTEPKEPKTRADIIALQQDLARDGLYNTRHADGIIGKETIHGRTLRADIDGTYTNQFIQNALANDTPLTRSDVRQMQAALNNATGLGIAVDGFAETETAGAVATYIENNPQTAAMVSDTVRTQLARYLPETQYASLFENDTKTASRDQASPETGQIAFNSAADGAIMGAKEIKQTVDAANRMTPNAQPSAAA